MTYYINDLELVDTNILKRTSADSWSVKHKSAENIPYIEQVNQKPTRWNLNMEFTGAGRYDMINSIRTGIRDCEKILVRSTNKYLFGSQKYVWLAQSSFNVDEGAGKVIPGTLQGMIDKYQIHTCDFTTNWSVQNFEFLILGTAHNGKYSLEAVDSSPDAATTYRIKYIPSGWTLDISKNNYIGLWIKTSTTNLIAPFTRLFLFTGSDYSYAVFPTLTATLWKWCEFDLANDFTDMGAGATLSSIDRVDVSISTNSSPPSNITLNIDDIRTT